MSFFRQDTEQIGYSWNDVRMGLTRANIDHEKNNKEKMDHPSVPSIRTFNEGSYIEMGEIIAGLEEGFGVKKSREKLVDFFEETKVAIMTKPADEGEISHKIYHISMLEMVIQELAPQVDQVPKPEDVPSTKSEFPPVERLVFYDAVVAELEIMPEYDETYKEQLTSVMKGVRCPITERDFVGLKDRVLKMEDDLVAEDIFEAIKAVMNSPLFEVKEKGMVDAAINMQITPREAALT